MPLAASTMPPRQVAPERPTLRAGVRHMRLSRAVEEFLQERQLEGSLLTYKAYKSDLQLLVSLATIEQGDNVSSFTPEVIRLFFRKKDERGLAAETKLRARSALSEFGKWALRRRLILVNPMAEAAPRIRRPKRAPRPFTLEERARLLALALSPEETMLRSLLYYAGVRVSEVTGLRWRHVRLSNAEQRGALRIIGKGDKERVVPMLRELDASLRAWLAAPGVQPRMLVGGLVLERKGAPLRVRRIEYMVAKWGVRAEVADCTPHRWRHSTATLLFEQGVDVRLVQRILGHESIATTMQYTQVSDAAMDRAMDSLEAKMAPGVLPTCILHTPPTPEQAEL